MRDDVLAEVERGGLTESEHRGTLVVLDANGEVRIAVGDVHAPMYPRSSLKPVQAAAMVRHGLAVEPRLLALVSASHSGSPWHVAGVEELLAVHRLGLSALQCIEGLPLGSAERDAYVRDGGIADRLHFNCSGKHAGFVATCMLNDWDVSTYLDVDHPVQRAVRKVVEELSGEEVSSVTVDGCGAPLFAMSLHGLAVAVRAIAAATADAPDGSVAAAMRAYPEMVGGTGRDDTVAMQRMPGLIAKGGAEGVMVMALPDGRACAMKVSDGNARGYQPAMHAVLRMWGMADEALAQLPLASVLGGGKAMGRVRLPDKIAGMLGA